MQPLITLASSLLVAITAALVGLWVWRIQQITARKLAVAEEATTAMWEAADTLRAARSRGIFASEGATYPGVQGEDDRAAEVRKTYYVVRERLLNNSEKFARLSAVRPPVRYHLGDSALKPIDDLFRVRWEILGAVDILIKFGALVTADNEDHRRLMHTAFTAGDNDPVADRIDAAEKALEAICFKVTRSAEAFIPRL